MRLSFHWRLIQGGEKFDMTMARQVALRAAGLPDFEAQADFCREAERCGIESLLVDISFAKPDPITLSTALGLSTDNIHFMVAARSGLLSPTFFVQQINTFSALTSGRVCLNVVAGHSPEEQKYYGDFLAHDERYARTEEFLAICHAFWAQSGAVNFHGKYYRVEEGKLNTPFVSPARASPKIFIGGNSNAARDLAIRQGSCWMRLCDTPEKVREQGRPVLAAGKEVGLRLSVIVGSTHAEAVGMAATLVRGIAPASQERAFLKEFTRRSDSESIKSTYELAETEWLTPYLWTGAVRSHGAPAIALVGTPAEIATAIMEYRDAGVSQFILSGWPKREAMISFGTTVLPLVRQLERERGDV